MCRGGDTRVGLVTRQTIHRVLALAPCSRFKVDVPIHPSLEITPMDWSKLNLMSLTSILLRVLLCLALAFNGMSAALASVHVAPHKAGAQEKGAVKATETPAGYTMAGMPCHDMGAAQGDEGSTSTDETPLRAPDCCKESCQCACMHGVASAIIPLSVVPVEYHAQLIVVLDTAAYAPPILQHLIRPPIG